MVGKLHHGGLALPLGALLLLFLFRAQPLGLDHALFEDLHRTGHVADFVLMVDDRDGYAQLISGKPGHGLCQAAYRLDHLAQHHDDAANDKKHSNDHQH